MKRQILGPLSEKKIGKSAQWTLNKSRILHETPFRRYREDDLTFPSGRCAQFHYVESPDVVMVVPFTPEKKIILLESYRVVIDRWVYELPGGLMPDISYSERDPDELISFGARELKEEVGATYQSMELLGFQFMAKGVARLKNHYLLAKNVVRHDELAHEEGETIRSIVELTQTEVLEWIQRGKLIDGDSTLGLLWAFSSMS